MTGKKELQVSAIENGTVIDRIPSNKLFTVISILGLDDPSLTMTCGTNLNSNAIGKKAIIKLWDKYLADEEINKLIEERQLARKNKDFKKADEIRDLIISKGIILEDTREGVKWQRA